MDWWSFCFDESCSKIPQKDQENPKWKIWYKEIKICLIFSIAQLCAENKHERFLNTWKEEKTHKSECAIPWSNTCGPFLRSMHFGYEKWWYHLHSIAKKSTLSCYSSSSRSSPPSTFHLQWNLRLFFDSNFLDWILPASFLSLLVWAAEIKQLR